ncbi:uncharacterized protein [Diadema antillarum]|uniref:uncharacterized protein n=1 Tax=Diadema antillarum TaxID=105358 RepID=UPI003A870BE3
MAVTAASGRNSDGERKPKPPVPAKPPRPVPIDQGLYGVVNKPKPSQSSPAHQTAPGSEDLYAIPEKPTERPQPEPRTPDGAYSETYATVDKTRGGKTPAPNVGGRIMYGEADAESTPARAEDVYAVVDKSSKSRDASRDATSQQGMSYEEELYAVVDKRSARASAPATGQRLVSEPGIYAAVNKEPKTSTPGPRSPADPSVTGDSLLTAVVHGLHEKWKLPGLTRGSVLVPDEPIEKEEAEADEEEMEG